MALSEWDQSRLREIEEHTRATDPDFVTRLDLAVVLRHRRQLRRMCWWLQALGAWMTLMGLSAAHGVISVGAIVAGGGCALMVWSPSPREVCEFRHNAAEDRFGGIGIVHGSWSGTFAPVTRERGAPVRRFPLSR